MKPIFLFAFLPFFVLFAQGCSTTEVKDADINPVPSETPAVAQPRGDFTDGDVKTAMDDFVRGHKNRDGSLDLKAMQEGKLKKIQVTFVGAHPAVSLSATSALACSEFKENKKVKKVKKVYSYDVCFWMAPGSDGRLTVQPEKAEIQRVNNKRYYEYDKAGNKLPTALDKPAL